VAAIATTEPRENPAARPHRAVAHLVVEDLRDAINLLPPSPFAASLLQDPRSTPSGVQNSTITTEENQVIELERETGIEPATLSLGTRSEGLAADVQSSLPWEKPPLRRGTTNAASPVLAAFPLGEAPIEPHGVAEKVHTGERRDTADQAHPDPLAASGGAAWLAVRDVAKQLRVSSATVDRLIDRGELQRTRVSNAIRITLANLATFRRRRA